MIKIDPIIAVKDVEGSSKWYHQVFGFGKAHGEEDIAVLVPGNEEIQLCLHKTFDCLDRFGLCQCGWSFRPNGEHQHGGQVLPLSLGT